MVDKTDDKFYAHQGHSLILPCNAGSVRSEPVYVQHQVLHRCPQQAIYMYSERLLKGPDHISLSMSDSALNEAKLKKKFVSCPAGGRNCGQSGGRNFFFFPHFFSPMKILSIFRKKKKLAKMKKKKSPVAPFSATRPVYWKHNYFYEQPQHYTKTR